jgi:hypothetical protein
VAAASIVTVDVAYIVCTGPGAGDLPLASGGHIEIDDLVFTLLCGKKGPGGVDDRAEVGDQADHADADPRPMQAP